QLMSMSSGSRVRRDGTIAMSSNPYARLPFLPRPMSISNWSSRDGVLRPSLHFRVDLQIAHLDLAEQPLDPVPVDRAGAEVLGRLGSPGAPGGEAVRRLAPVVERRRVASQEGVARADGRDRL